MTIVSSESNDLTVRTVIRGIDHIFCDCLLATAPELRAAWRETYEPVVGVMKRAPATEPA